MAVSVVAICNLALQKLETPRISSLDDDSTAARECNAAYEHCRNLELRAHPWNFAKKRAQLAASAVDPDFDYDYAYPVPADFLRLIRPQDAEVDWVIEAHEDQTCILSNDSGPLEIRYIARIEDPVKFDPLFDEMVACRMAKQMCKKLTGSNTKKDDADQDYREAQAEARRVNAFENAPIEQPEDDWVTARR